MLGLARGLQPRACAAPRIGNPLQNDSGVAAEIATVGRALRLIARCGMALSKVIASPVRRGYSSPPTLVRAARLDLSRGTWTTVPPQDGVLTYGSDYVWADGREVVTRWSSRSA